MDFDFTMWWKRVIARLYEGGIDDLPAAKPVDREAYDAGMAPDQWAWVYYTAGIDEADLEAAATAIAAESDGERRAGGI